MYEKNVDGSNVCLTVTDEDSFYFISKSIIDNVGGW